MITVYQNKTTSKYHNEINALGSWDKAAEKYPGVKAHLACSLRGSKNFDKSYFPFYTKVAVVDTDNLEKAFEAMNLWETDLVTKLDEKCHSMSVGDIVEKDGQFWMVDSEGFGKIGVMGIV